MKADLIPEKVYWGPEISDTRADRMSNKFGKNIKRTFIDYFELIVSTRIQQSGSCEIVLRRLALMDKRQLIVYFGLFQRIFFNALT